MASDGIPTEIRINRIFILVAVCLIALAFAAFFWLAGVLEWRGTSAETQVRLTLECKDLTKAGKTFDAVIDLDVDEDEGGTTSIQFGLSAADDDEFRPACQRITIETSRAPLRLIDAGTVDAPGDDQEIRVQGDAAPGGGQTPFYQARHGLANPFYTATFTAVPRLKLVYRRDELMRFVGLSEREVEFSFSAAVRSSDHAGLQSKRLTFAIRPPENFSVASSDIPLKLEESRFWGTDTFIQGNTNSVSLKNSSKARLDHILDASISAVLGAGVGALLASWLNLKIKQSS